MSKRKTHNNDAEAPTPYSKNKKQKETNPYNINDVLPDEMLLNIFSYCGNYLFFCINTSKHWYRILKAYCKKTTSVRERQFGLCFSLAFRGNLNLLKWWHSKELWLPNDAFDAAVEGGDIATIEWLLENNIFVADTVPFRNAAKGGHLEVLELLLNRVNPDFPADQFMCDRAAKQGHLHVLKWIHEYGYGHFFSDRLCVIAASRGDLEMLKWLDSTLNVNNANICSHAALGGHLKVLQWARKKKNYPWDGDTCANAAQGGHLEVLKWALENGCPRHIMTCSYAARGGYLEALKLARSYKCPWDSYLYENTAKGGHLEVLQWAHENGCPKREYDWGVAPVCGMAALGGHLDVLKWARENGFVWKAHVCAWAALKGHLEVLQWARENGCDWNEKTCENAASGGHLEVLQWARANECPWNENTCNEAALKGHLEVLQWAYENDCPCNADASIRAAEAGNLEILQWMHHEEDFPLDYHACRIAANTKYSTARRGQRNSKWSSERARNIIKAEIYLNIIIFLSK